MTNDQSINETLDVIRRALEDDNAADLKENVLVLNRKVNSDGTINIIEDKKIQKEEIKKILDDTITNILEKNLDIWLEKKLNIYLKKYLDKNK